MKTLLLALEYASSFGGVETYYQKLAEYWPDEFAVIDNRNKQLINKSFWILNWLPAWQQSMRTDADWIIAGEILPIGTAVWLASFFKKCKYAVFLHGLDFSLATTSAWKRFVSRRILRRAQLIFCANSRTAQLVGEFMGDIKKIVVATPGIDAEAPIIRPELIAGVKENYGLEGMITFLTIGRLVKRKGFDKVIEALPEICNQMPNVRYIIAGQGPEEQNIRKMIADESLAGKVILLNNVTEQEKWAWLSVADIFIMPAREINGDYEGFGIVYLEANLFGKPVIAGRSGGVGDAVEDQVNGLLVHPDSVPEIAAAMISLAQQPELRTKLGRAGEKRAREDFAWPKKVQSIYNALK